jgi:hypothetical protein
VRVLSLARVLFALLAFQLAVGLQMGVAHAATSPALPMAAHAPTPSKNITSIPASASGTAKASSSTASTDDACPMHSSPSQGSPHAKAPPNTSSDKHDCCKSSGCQCQCGNVPLAFNVALNRDSLASALVRPVRAVRAVVAPADTHFRPPIVS